MINVIPVEVMDGWNVLEQCLSHDELIALKFGLILASYPDVLPINLSKKSEGDML